MLNLGYVIRSLLLAAKRHCYASLSIEYNHHFGTLIGNSNVILAIDLDRMRVRSCVEVVADLAHALAVRRNSRSAVALAP